MNILYSILFFIVSFNIIALTILSLRYHLTKKRNKND